MLSFIRMLPSLGVLLLSIDIPAAAVHADKPTLPDSLHLADVFTSGEEGYHTYRIPALLVTQRGTLLAFCEGRKTGRGDHGDLDLVVKRSRDGGRTWGPLELVYEEGGEKKITIGNPCPVVDQATGAIWLPFCRDNNDVFVTHSTDDGKAWAEPRVITKDVKKADWTWYATGPGAAIQLTRGKHKGRLLVPCDHRVRAKDGGWKGAGRSHAIYSDDHGKTWQLGEPTDWAMNECTAAELPDGDVLLNMRSYLGHGCRAIARSSDGGETWSECRDDEALIEPVCQGALVRYTWPEDGRSRIVFSNPASTTKRHKLTARMSYDEGKTWPVSRVVYEGSAAYSSLAVLPGGPVGILFERDDYKKISFTPLSLEWLTADE